MKNYLKEKEAPDFIKKRNKKFLQAYSYVLMTIGKIQAFLEDENLRLRIESDFRDNPNTEATMFQCTTMFCIVSLGCDNMGRYNIVYSTDYRIKEMISVQMASGLVRRINEFTPEDMEPFTLIGSLCEDCVEIFQNIIKQMEAEPYHKLIVTPMHEKS